jgi:hypothetical protein
MDVKIEDYRLKPLRKLYRPYFWLNIEHMAELVDDYNHTPHSAFYHMFIPFQKPDY